MNASRSNRQVVAAPFRGVQVLGLCFGLILLTSCGPASKSLESIADEAEKAVLLHLHHFIDGEKTDGHPIRLVRRGMVEPEHDNSGLNRLTVYCDGVAGDRRFNVVIEVMHPDHHRRGTYGREFTEMPREANLADVTAVRFGPPHPDLHLKATVAHAALRK